MTEPAEAEFAGIGPVIGPDGTLYWSAAAAPGGGRRFGTVGALWEV